jgi:hypothetical protein
MSPLSLLFCDTDCLVQIFVADCTGLLKWLRTKYRVTSVVVPEVHAELSWHLKFKDKFDSDLRKALAAGVLTVFDYSRSDQHLAEFFPIPAAASSASLAIARTGYDYALRVGPGEAYSHASCIYLGMPLLSHDKSAIDTLRVNNLKTAAPVLRLFDLLAFAYDNGELSTKDIKNVRQKLQNWGQTEYIPREFKTSSVESGLASFTRRLRDRTSCTGIPPACQEFYDTLYLPQDLA